MYNKICFLAEGFRLIGLWFLPAYITPQLVKTLSKLFTTTIVGEHYHLGKPAEEGNWWLPIRCPLLGLRLSKSCIFKGTKWDIDSVEIWNFDLPIPDICHFFYTRSIFKFQILHPKIEKKKNSRKHSQMSLKSKVYAVFVFNLENFLHLTEYFLHGHRPWCP